MPVLRVLARPGRGLALGVVLAVAACGPLRTPLAGTGGVAATAPSSFAPLVRKVLPAVVNIAVTETVPGDDVMARLPPGLRDSPLGREIRRRFGNQAQEVAGAGSGFIVAPDGVIVTNNHVIAHAEQIQVSFLDGSQLPARVLGRDKLTDIAVLKVDPPHPLPAITWGDSHKVQVGDWILAAGNPFGLGGSVTAGIVSAEGRSLGGGPFDRFLQLDAPINPGNSGGPAFDMAGQVVGMTTAIVTPSGGSVGIGFAIPSDLVRRIVDQLRLHGHIERGWLGVAIANVTDPSGATVAVGVVSVEKNSPAARAGLRPGDRLLAVNGQEVHDSGALIRAIAAVPPGQIARITLRRGRAVATIPVAVGRRPADEAN
ncbi:MAG: trypsin-like peptidase domain-containing protein [Rhodospirillales bacterium]|jgi:serine protease Do|nr:trypsin-like peptidase domain-containing protein [Rhodospirillales bacterium]